MRGSAFIAFFGIATAISGSLVGCSDDDDADEAAPAKVTKSGEGESCRFTDDCGADLACYNGVCLPSPSGTGGTDGTGGSSTGGRGGTASSVLGGEGESCTRRADCALGFSCFNQRCTEGGNGEGGEGNTPTQGGRGETCVLSSDCTEGLVCRPPSSGGGGVCTDSDSGVTPTGMVCGAECLEAADCCGIPVELHAMIGVKSCADLADVLMGVTCDDLATVEQQAQCLVNAAFCEDCDDTIWACTAGRCSYTADCTASGLVPGGCPTWSRGGYLLSPTCDIGETDKCQAPAGTPICDEDSDCDMQPVSDDFGDSCNGGECTCHEEFCLRRCNSDLDCRVGFACEEATEVCIPEDACTEDITCQRLVGDVRFQCVNNACTRPCETDLDCNNAGLLNGGFDAVCNASQMCEPIGCTQNADCSTLNGVRLFCTEPQSATAARAAQSALTD